MSKQDPHNGLVLAQSSLGLSGDRFRLFVESVKDYAMIVLETDGMIASWNAGAQHIHGYTADEIINQHYSRFYPAEAISRGWPDYELRMAKAEGHFEDEGWLIRKDGSRFWANIVFTTLYDHLCDFRGYAVVIRDLTEHKRVAELEETIRRMKEFLAVLGHELRNPLAPIRNVLGILAAGLSGPEQLNWCRNVVERQVGQLTRLIDELFDIARITTGKVSLAKEELDLGAVMMSAVEAITPQINQRRQHLTVEVPKPPVFVHGDLTRLLQVLQNLLNNASKFTPEDGAITLSLVREEGHAVLSVRDTGMGISAASLPHIFDLFTQGEHTTPHSHGGLGIGLALVKELVSLHGGTIEAESPGPGQGSKFVVALPALEKQLIMATEKMTPRPQPVVPLRLLVVDDNRDTAESMQRLLEPCGHKVRIACDGKTALEVAAEFAPHAVLLDLDLPGVTGYDIAQEMLKKLPLPHPLLIAVTGYGQAEDRRRTRLAGFDEHLVKPVDINTLTRVLSRIRRTSQPLPIFRLPKVYK